MNHEEMEVVGAENESEHDLAQLNMRLQSLMDKAPSDATATLFIRHEKDGYKGLLKIRSIQKKFVAACTSSTLQELAERIVGEARSQIDVWKRDRYANGGLSFSS